MNHKSLFLSIISFTLNSLPLVAFSQYEQLEVTESSNSNIHGFCDVAIKNDYITPRGLLVTKTGVTTQVLAGLSLDVYKDPHPTSIINKMSIIGFVWNDLWSDQHHPTAGSWNEFDWGVGTNFTIKEDWTVGAQYLEFLSPPGNFSPEKNIEFLLAYNDSKWKLPFVFNPYAKWFWAVTGDSTVVVGKRGRTFDVELGLVPTVDFQKTDFPVILSAPTWITVGPAEFWNGGKLGLKHKKNNFGVFSTGLQCEIPISYIPVSLGSWYLRVGVQYYHIINDSLLEAQTVTLGVKSFHSAHRNIWVATAGIGFRF